MSTIADLRQCLEAGHFTRLDTQSKRSAMSIRWLEEAQVHDLPPNSLHLIFCMKGDIIQEVYASARDNTITRVR